MAASAAMQAIEDACNCAVDALPEGKELADDIEAIRGQLAEMRVAMESEMSPWLGWTFDDARTQNFDSNPL